MLVTMTLVWIRRLLVLIGVLSTFLLIAHVLGSEWIAVVSDVASLAVVAYLLPATYRWEGGR